MPERGRAGATLPAAHVRDVSARNPARAGRFAGHVAPLSPTHHWPDEAGRAAYLAGLHAAQALIFESTGKAIKRHSGVQREFGRLAKDDPRFDMDLRAFLPRAYNTPRPPEAEPKP